MALDPGVRIGVYEVLSLIGAGGMGEVYLARDSKLNRNVALKVLPDVFAADAERLARFRREAQVLAALRHRNIAVIHGLEDAPDAAGRHVRALVLEHIEGESLAERIAAGPVPLDEALAIAQQIGEALQVAHDQGVIHRDLKPSNIKITPDGTVKVLDFGLAKLGNPGEAAPGASSSVSLSPTITSPAGTMLGVILGTAPYMAPEQAKGKAADKRSDVWAFGCVLFEMLTGRRAFEGDDISDTLASVLKGEPEWAAIGPPVPASVKTLIRSCLTKDRRARLGDIAGALFVLRNAAALVEQGGPSHVRPVPQRRWTWWHVAAAIVAVFLVAAGSGWLGWQLRPDDPRRSPVTRFRITLAENESFTTPGRHLVAVSPDSRRVVFSAGGRLNIREMGQLDTTPIRGTEGVGPAAPRGPLFSPDGEWIAFWTSNQLKRISVNGGAAEVLATVANNQQIGGHWASDDTIVFALPTGIWRVPATGGTLELLVKAEGNRRFLHPQVLPGGRALLYTALGTEGGAWDDASIMVRVEDGTERQVAVGADARYLSSGHLVFYARGSIMAVPFDVRTLERGAPVPMVDNVAVSSAGGIAHFDVSSTGTLAYVTGYLAAAELRIPMWIDRQGRETPLGAEPRNYLYIRISPDQSRVALDVAGENRDIYVWDIGQRATKRLTTDPVLDRAPIFTRDSRRIIFSSDRNGLPSLFWQSADGVGGAQQLTESDDAHYSMSAAPDGILVRVTPGGAGGGAADIYRMSMEPDHKLTPIITEEFVEQNAEVSHNGRWMAYQTDRSGRDDILVRPYPANDAEFPVSTAGGTEPLWSTDDSELFYRSPTGGIMRVVVKPGTTWAAGAPEQVLPGEGLRVGSQGANPFRTYDVSADGRRFLVLKNVPSSENATSAPTIIVVQNWLEELKRRVPVK